MWVFSSASSALAALKERVCSNSYMKTALLLVITLLSACCAAQEITVAAAADLNYALRDLAVRFEAQSGVRAISTFGSSGNFTVQIENGAPFDVFLSADIEYPQKLAAAGAVEPGSLYEYAVGRIVLWVSNRSRLDLRRGLEALLDPSVSKIAIANPDHAPYGRAAVAALKAAGLYDRLQGKFVLGENIAQAAQFVETGNADAGLLALSLALAPPLKSEGRYVEVPTNLYPPLRQAAVVLKSSRHKPAAQRFLEFLKTPAAREILRKYGFAQP